MEEKELVQKLSHLKETIKPRREWVFSVRQNILAKETMAPAAFVQKAGFAVFFANVLRSVGRPVIAIPVLSLLVIGGVIADAASESLPGDKLYALRSIVEKAQVSLSADDKKTLTHLELAQQRLDDLRKIAEGNKVKNLHPAITEFKGRVGVVSKEFSQMVKDEPKKALQASKEIVELQKDKAQLEIVLGAAIGGEELDALKEATQTLVANELKDLEGRTLTEEQKTELENAKKAYESGEYQKALESLWIISGIAIE